jgi:hypothetical protein
MVGHHFSRKKPSSKVRYTNYTLGRQVERPYNALETHRVAVPWCTVVAGQIDVSSGGEWDAMTPMRKLKI